MVAQTFTTALARLIQQTLEAVLMVHSVSAHSTSTTSRSPKLKFNRTMPLVALDSHSAMVRSRGRHLMMVSLHLRAQPLPILCLARTTSSASHQRMALVQARIPLPPMPLQYVAHLERRQLLEPSPQAIRAQLSPSPHQQILVAHRLLVTQQPLSRLEHLFYLTAPANGAPEN